MPAASRVSCPPYGGPPAFGMVVAAPRQKAARAAADPVESDRAAEAAKQRHRQSGPFRLGEPAFERVERIDRQEALEAVAEHGVFEPLDGGADQFPAIDDVAGIGAPCHAAGQHVRGMGPLPAEDRDDLQDPAADAEGTDHRAAFQRPECARDLGGQRMVGVASIQEVGHEEQEGLAQVALYVLGHQAEASDQRCLRRYRQPPEPFEGQYGGVEMGGAADAADTRRDHQRVARRAIHQQLFETAEQGADTAGIDDATAFDIDLEFEVSLDPVEIDTNGSPRHPQGSISRLISRTGAAAFARFL